MVKLASGQQMATKLKGLGVDVTAADQGPDHRRQRRRRARPPDARPRRTRWRANTPLWFYILREAELNDGRLSGVGAPDRRRDVPPGDGGQPVLDRARPDLPSDAWAANATTFEMTDLIFFAYAGKTSGINPLGGA